MAALNGVELFRAFALMVRTMVRAIRGNSSGARADGDEAIAVSERIGWPIGVSQARCALGFLALSEGDIEVAVEALEPVVSAAEAVGVYEWLIAMLLPDAIEAMVAIGDIDRPTRLTEALADWGLTFGRPWALATSGRCRALLDAAAGDLDSAAAATAEALVGHERLPYRSSSRERCSCTDRCCAGAASAGRHARPSSVRGESSPDLGAPLWAEKARAEIARIGVRRAPEELTEGEERVAELAAQGLTNPEIAARLFMSRRTVEANLARALREARHPFPSRARRDHGEAPDRRPS